MMLKHAQKKDYTTTYLAFGDDTCISMISCNSVGFVNELWETLTCNFFLALALTIHIGYAAET